MLVYSRQLRNVGAYKELIIKKGQMVLWEMGKG